jgi:hypothetical protein
MLRACYLAAGAGWLLAAVGAGVSSEALAVAGLGLCGLTLPVWAWAYAKGGKG